MKFAYQAQPKQSAFHFSTADEVFYGGSAGGGKSEAILWDAVAFCAKNNNVHASIFRRTYPELEKSMILNFLSKVPTHWYKYNKQEHRAYFYKTKSILEFNHCQYEQDVFKFQSVEYDHMYFDELTHFPEFIYKYLLSRLRTTKKSVHPQVKSASNPGGIGHHWVKKRFITDSIPNSVTLRTDEENGSSYTTEFIPARVFDNKYLMDNDPAYVERLMRLPEDDRKQLLDGNWDTVAGQFFTEWNSDIHVIAPFEIPDDWRRFRAMDWGYRNPTCVVWIAVDKEKRLYVYKELYVTQTTDTMVAEQIDAMSRDKDGKPENILYTVADPALWSVNQYEKGESLASRFMSMGIGLMKADNNRLSGASTFHSYLEVSPIDKQPSIQFFSTCYNSVRTIPALIHDPRRPEDVDTDGEDHAYDAVRYGVMSHPIPRLAKVKKDERKNFDFFLKQKKEQRERAGYVGSY